MDWSADIEITILTSAGVIIAAIHYLLVVFELGVVRDDIRRLAGTPAPALPVTEANATTLSMALAPAPPALRTDAIVIRAWIWPIRPTAVLEMPSRPVRPHNSKPLAANRWCRALPTGTTTAGPIPRPSAETPYPLPQLTAAPTFRGIVPFVVELREWRTPCFRTEVVYSTPRQQPHRRAGPARPRRRPGSVGRGSPAPAGSAAPPPPARSPPTVESSVRRATA